MNNLKDNPSPLPSNLFQGTASYYSKFRPAYPLGIWDWITSEFALDGTARLLDVGCGTGQVFIPLASKFEQVVALDPDAEMLVEAARVAKEQGISNVTFLQRSGEEIKSDLGSFRLAAFGASFHWMDRAKVANALHSMLEEGGGLAVIAPTSIWEGAEPWKQIVKDTLAKFAGPERRAGASPFSSLVKETHAQGLARSLFVGAPQLRRDFYQTKTWSLDELLGYLHSTSFASKAVLGAATSDFDEALRKALLDFNLAGEYAEVIQTMVVLVKKLG